MSPDPQPVGPAKRTTPRPRSPAVTIVLALLVTTLDGLLLAAALGGFAALLSHARALALLAVWAVGGVTLALLRPVRAQDAVATEPDPRFVMVALFFLPLLTPPVAALGERLGVWPIPGGAAVRWGGVALAALGLGFRIAAMARLGARFSPLLAMQREHALETRGLYGTVRHPGYLGAGLAALGAALAFGSALAIPLVVAMGLLLRNRAVREEALLERHFGEEYRSYRLRTGRFLPRLAPSRTASRQPAGR